MGGNVQAGRKRRGRILGKHCGQAKSVSGGNEEMLRRYGVVVDKVVANSFQYAGGMTGLRGGN